MPLSAENQALVTKLVSVHERAASGDREAVHFVKSLKTRALAGEEKARRIYNTLAVIHWRKQRGGDYDKAEAYYRRLMAKEPQAMAKLQVLLNRVRSGDQEALTLFRVLKSIHGKLKSSAFSDGPGAPRVGGYGLPQEHRAGIIIGGIADSLSPYAYQNVFGATPPSHRPHIGHGGGYPMSRIPQYGTYGQALYGSNFSVSGIGVAIGANEPGVQALTPDAVSNLMSLMIRARAMPMIAAAASAIQSAFSQSSPGGSSFTTTPNPSGMSTVPAPSGGAVQPTMMAMLQKTQAALAPVAATPAQMEAFKTQYQTPQDRVTMGQLVANNNPFMLQEKGRSISADDPEALTGFYHGIITSLGNSASGPGQDGQRDQMLYPTTAENSGLNSRRLYGFGVARQMMYKATLAKTPIVLPTTVKSLGRVTGTTMTEAERAAMLANQGICNRAFDALQRNSPAAPGLVNQCAATRDANIAKGEYFADAMPTNDPRYRVALTNAGMAVVSKNPQLMAFADSLANPATDPDGQKRRGFIMAMGVRAGKMDPAFPAFVRPGLAVSPALLAGFDLGMNMK